MRPGDVIPISMPEFASVYAEDVPVFRGRMGNANGHKAIRFEQLMRTRVARHQAELLPDPIPA